MRPADDGAREWDVAEWSENPDEYDADTDAVMDGSYSK